MVATKEKNAVLIIDDDIDFSESLADMLDIIGYRAVIANNITQSRKLISDETPRVVLIDIHIGKSNGIDFINQIRNSHPEILFLIVTAHAAIDSALEALKVGAYDYLRKPVSNQELVAALDRCFDKLRLESKNKQVEQQVYTQNKQLVDLNNRLKAIVESASVFNNLTDINNLAKALLDEYMKRLAADQGCVIFFENDDAVSYNSNSEDSIKQKIPDPEKDPFISRIMEGIYIYIPAFEKNEYEHSPVITFKPQGSLLAVPFIGKGGLIKGCVVLTKTGLKEFQTYDIDIALVMSSLSGNAIAALEIQEELNQKEAILQESRKMEAMGRLAGGIAHDFNNILTGILGYSELIKMETEEGKTEKSIDYISEIKKAVTYGAALTQQLLTFSRRQKMNIQATDITSLLTEMSSMLKVLLGDNINFQITVPDRKVFIEIDTNQFKRVVLNIAMNAKDAMPDSGTFTILCNIIQNAAPKDPRIELILRDTGSGIPQSVQPHIFEPFYTTKDKGKGTGLGLSTVFGIVRQSNGEICVNSAPEEGSEFIISFPIINVEEAETEAEKSKIDVDLKDLRILLVEDDEAIIKSVTNILKKHDVSVHPVKDGLMALEEFYIEEHRYDIVITDVMMPRLSGDRLAEKLLQTHPDLPVLFISGYSNETLFQNPTLKVTDSNFLQKPFSTEQLFERITNLIHEKHNQDKK